MDSLSKEKKDEMATCLAILALYDGEVRFFIFIIGFMPALLLGVYGSYIREV